jgi:hypothetical protein
VPDANCQAATASIRENGVAVVVMRVNRNPAAVNSALILFQSALLMRACTAFCLMTYGKNTGFSATPLLNTLRKEDPRSLRALAVAQRPWPLGAPTSTQGIGRALPWLDLTRGGGRSTTYGLLMHQAIRLRFDRRPHVAAVTKLAQCAVPKGDPRLDAAACGAHGSLSLIR